MMDSSVDDISEHQHHHVALARLLGLYMESHHGCLDLDAIERELVQEANKKQAYVDQCNDLFQGLELMIIEDGANETENEREMEEKQLTEEIQQLRLEELELLGHFEVLNHLEDRVAVLQTAFWREFHESWQESDGAQEELDSLSERTDILIGCKNLLKQTNILNDAFCIWYDGPFGTISGLRLGRLPEIVVEWSEINAAWGQVALLLATLARQVHFTFSKYRIIPMGSTSKMAKVGNEKTRYELYCTGGFFKSSFNNAMVCILHCVQELGDFAENTDRTMTLPYPINADKCGDLSIRTGGSDVNWTRALKNFLTDLKWLVAWSTKRQRMR